jgi:glucose/arabinose dehydrogenase
MRLERAFPNVSFLRTVHLAYPNDGARRLFLVLQPGRIMVFPSDDAAASASLFLDIQDRVNSRGEEEGLLGLAFDPGYRLNGYFYVNYTAASPRRSVISRFSVSPPAPDRADAGSELVLLEVLQPYSNHNGGSLAFGPDGYLYIGLGDGGARGDPHGHGQNRATLLGSILRIDVRGATPAKPYTIPRDNPFVGEGGGVREEILAYGLRNPWRFSFDRATGELWAGDVGQDDYEEIDLIKPGRNYGWNITEGFHCYPPAVRTCRQAGLELPIVEYPLTAGDCAVIGGYVYRGARLPFLYGAYVYGDFCSGRIWALRYDGSRVTEHRELAASSLPIAAFGEEPEGEIYILSFDRRMYRLVAAD